MKAFFLLCLSFALGVSEDIDLELFAAYNNKFSGEVYNELLVDNTGNIIVSPFSVETILALTQAGADGDTGAEIRSTLHLPASMEGTDSLMKKILPMFHNSQYKLHVANKVYIENKFPIRQTFQQIAEDDYEAGFENVEFQENVEAAAEINEWVEDETEGLIKNLINPDNLDKSTKFVLVNALYFQANWTTPFNTQLTRKSSFFTSADTEVSANFMSAESHQLNYAESDELDAQIVELPFLGGASMVIVLPRKKEGIAILEKQSASLLAAPTFTRKFVQVVLPKFEIESTINFAPVLYDMGIRRAFSNIADFSGIAGNPGDLFIDSILQKSYILVNEGGVTAAAATEVGGATAAIPPIDERFIADHPFAFYIKVNDAVLFEGRVLVPQDS